MKRELRRSRAPRPSPPWRSTAAGWKRICCRARSGDFRLGDELWRKKLRIRSGSDLAPEEILASAEARPGRHPGRDVRGRAAPVPRVLRRARRRRDPGRGHGHPPRAGPPGRRPSHQRDHRGRRPRADLAELTDFVREQDLVTVPDDPVEIIVMPEHQRGFCIAYCDSPGPAGEERHDLLRHQPHARRLDARARGDLLPRVQRLHAAEPDHPRGHARPLPADRPRQRVRGAHAAARHLRQRHLRRGLGHLRRAAHGRGRLRRARAAAAAAEDAPAADHQRHHRPEDPHRGHDRGRGHAR